MGRVFFSGAQILHCEDRSTETDKTETDKTETDTEQERRRERDRDTKTERRRERDKVSRQGESGDSFQSEITSTALRAASRASLPPPTHHAYAASPAVVSPPGEGEGHEAQHALVGGLVWYPASATGRIQEEKQSTTTSH